LFADIKILDKKSELLIKNSRRISHYHYEYKEDKISLENETDSINHNNLIFVDIGKADFPFDRNYYLLKKSIKLTKELGERYLLPRHIYYFEF